MAGRNPCSTVEPAGAGIHPAEPPEAARYGLGLRATWAAIEWSPKSAGGAVLPPPAAVRRTGPPRAARAESPAPPALRLRRARRRRRSGDGSTSSARRWTNGERGARNGERIFLAHIHMLHNRLGLSVVQERNHYQALAAAPPALLPRRGGAHDPLCPQMTLTIIRP